MTSRSLCCRLADFACLVLLVLMNCAKKISLAVRKFNIRVLGKCLFIPKKRSKFQSLNLQAQFNGMGAPA